MRGVTQKKRVLDHLIEKGNITSWEAIQTYGCTRLADVIFQLRENHLIESVYKTTHNRYGDPITFVVYMYKGEKSVNL